jgi:hypothetical protein
MDETRLFEKLRAIEALFEGATTDGERIAAGLARERILERISRIAESDPPVEYKFTMSDQWSRKVMLALLRRYGIRPYRYKGQRQTTVMARVSRKFIAETLWPEFEQISATLREYLSDITERVISETIHKDSTEAGEIENPKQLAQG